MPHIFNLVLNTNKGGKSSVSITQNVLKGLVRHPSSLIWVMTYSKRISHAAASQAAAGAKLLFKHFLANTSTKLSFAALQVANN